jgi:RNA-directed DNA polymerase
VVRQKVNPILRGWVNYFRIGNSSRVFNKIREFVLGRILRFIRRRQKRSGMGWNRISGDFLYGTLGLVYEYRLSWTSRKAMV